MKQYTCNTNIIIGNAKGAHRFNTQFSYTENFLRSCALTTGQIKKYFNLK